MADKSVCSGRSPLLLVLFDFLGYQSKVRYDINYCGGDPRQKKGAFKPANNELRPKSNVIGPNFVPPNPFTKVAHFHFWIFQQNTTDFNLSENSGRRFCRPLRHKIKTSILKPGITNGMAASHKPAAGKRAFVLT
jgi:hypothetical protein